MRAAFEHVDGASLRLFRFCFGLLIAWQAYRVVSGSSIEANLNVDHFHFTYFGFAWIRPMHAQAMYAIHYCMMVCGLSIAAGLLVRWAAAVYVVTFAYTFLCEQALYLNHHYLIILLAFLIVFLPHGKTVPRWTIWFLRIVVGIVYLYAGIAKLNVDWLAGQPVRMWLAKRVDKPWIGQFLDDEWTVWVVAYGGLILDLFIFPALVWRRTRLFGFFWITIFHLANKWLFNIGVFPWLMIPLTTVFFDPSWPRRFWPWGKRELQADAGAPGHRVLASFAVVFLIAHAAIPMRHFLYPGRVSWTEEGHLFSWHMKLRSKEGYTTFFVTDPKTGKTTPLDVRSELTNRQFRKMSTRPEMILQFAHFLRDGYRLRLGYDVEIRAEAKCSLNARPYQDLIDPKVDLAQVRSALWPPATWIVPLIDTEERRRY